MWWFFVFSVSWESTRLTSSKGIAPLSCVLYYLFPVQSGASQTREIYSCSDHRLTGGQLRCFLCLSLRQTPCQVICTAVQQRSCQFFLRVNGEIPLCKYVWMWSGDKEWQIFDLFSQKGEKNTFMRLEGLSQKAEERSLEFSAVHLWVSFFPLEIFAVGQGNSPSFWPIKSAVFAPKKVNNSKLLKK